MLRLARYIGKPGNVRHDTLGKLNPGDVISDPSGQLAERGDFEAHDPAPLLAAFEAVNELTPYAEEEAIDGTD